MLYTLPFKGRNYISSAYGYRTLNGKREYHAGWDVVGRDDKNVHPAADGQTLSSTIITNHNDLTWQWGNYVKVRMGDFDGFYCHMDKRYVVMGQNVTPAMTLGLMGNTGYSFGAHTHCEYRNKGKTSTVNPGELFGLPNMAGVTWDREAMDECTVGYLDCTEASYRWRRGPGTDNDLYRDGNGVQMYALAGVTYRVYAVTALSNGEVWCQITPTSVCSDVAVPELWVSAACGLYTAKEAPAVPKKPDSGSTVPEPSGPEGTESGGDAPDRPVDWDSDGNEFIISASRGDRPALREVCERLQLPVRNG